MFAVPKNPSPVPRAEKGRRKNGLKPKKREESQGDTDFMLQNGKQVEAGIQLGQTLHYS